MKKTDMKKTETQKNVPKQAQRAIDARGTYLLNRLQSRSSKLAVLKAEVISSIGQLRQSLRHPNRNSLWISYDKDLTEALLKNVSWRDAPLGEAVLVHDMSPPSLPALGTCFKHFAFGANGNFLAPDELAVALGAENRVDLFIGGSVDKGSETVTLWRGNLQTITVPFAAFAKSGDGTAPDFDKFSVIDYGQTIRLGDYEAAADALLYEFDAEFRRRTKSQRQATEQSFGASLRRLRKQRGLTRDDFGPDLSAKTIARIENGEVRRVQAKTLSALSKHLSVSVAEIESF